MKNTIMKYIKQNYIMSLMLNNIVGTHVPLHCTRPTLTVYTSICLGNQIKK